MDKIKKKIDELRREKEDLEELLEDKKQNLKENEVKKEHVGLCVCLGGGGGGKEGGGKYVRHFKP